MVPHGTSPSVLIPNMEDPPELSSASPLAQLLDTPQKPALMPPMMFASALKDSSVISGSVQHTDQPVLSASFQERESRIGDRFKNVEPLTRNQMIQALEYLLRTDSDFVVKLHEAYVKSFTEMVNHSGPGH